MFYTTQKSETILRKSVPSSTLLLSSNAIPNMRIYEKSTAKEPGTKRETKAKTVTRDFYTDQYLWVMNRGRL